MKKSKNNSNRSLLITVGVIAVLAILFFIFVPNAGQIIKNILGFVDDLPLTGLIPSSGESTSNVTGADTGTQNPAAISEDGKYTTKDDVALYIHTYGKLPSNFIKKDEAKKLGWDGNGNHSIWLYADQMSIGGDVFSNREELLPVAKGRKWYECDINYDGKQRGAERIVFSSDGLIYYTSDHYESFTQLY